MEVFYFLIFKPRRTYLMDTVDIGSIFFSLFCSIFGFLILKYLGRNKKIWKNIGILNIFFFFLFNFILCILSEF